MLSVGTRPGTISLALGLPAPELELPAELDAGDVLRVALRQGVAFVPGHAFAADGSRTGSNCMRLNFSHSTPEMIDEAVARLGRVLQTAAP